MIETPSNLRRPVVRRQDKARDLSDLPFISSEALDTVLTTAVLPRDHLGQWFAGDSVPTDDTRALGRQPCSPKVHDSITKVVSRGGEAGLDRFKESRWLVFHPTRPRMQRRHGDLIRALDITGAIEHQDSRVMPPLIDRQIERWGATGFAHGRRISQGADSGRVLVSATGRRSGSPGAILAITFSAVAR